jgi:hypothetical protein
MMAFLLTLMVAASAQTQQWTAQRVLRVGEEEGVSFGRISGVAAAPDGRFFVLDHAESRVHVFSPAGKLERTFGRRGAGPGELSAYAMNVFFSRGQLLVVDPMNRRLNVFGLDGTFVRSRQLEMGMAVALDWSALATRLVYLTRPLPTGMNSQRADVTYTVLSTDPIAENAPDTLLRITLPPSSRFALNGQKMNVTHDLRVPQIYLSTDGIGRTLVAVSDTYHIRVLTTDGQTSWLSRNIARRRLGRDALALMKANSDSALKAGARAGAAAAGGARGVPVPEIELILPEFEPALSAMLGSERFVLVSRSVSVAIPGNLAYEWDILGYDNRLLGTLKTPLGFRPVTLVGDRLYGVEKDELDVESIAVYRIAPK